MRDAVWDPAQDTVEEMQEARTPGGAWDVRAPLTPAALTWQPMLMDFSLTQILLLYLWVAA